jgi:hypothetical protein
VNIDTRYLPVNGSFDRATAARRDRRPVTGPVLASALAAGGGKTVVINRVDQLRDRMMPVLTSAVDPLEIAASLEADGLGDQAARTGFGFPDVFALAEHLYRTVPRDPAEPPVAPEPWSARPAEHVLHGLLYAVPAVCFPAVSPRLADPGTLLGFAAIVMVSWALGQALACLGHARTGQLDPHGARWLLLLGSIAGVLLLWAGAGIASALAPVRAPGLLFAAGQGTYVLAATVLLVLGRHRMLACCLAPAVMVSVEFLVLGRPAGLVYLVWCALAVSVLATMACAARCTVGTDRTGRRTPVPHELRGAVRHGLFGLAAAGLLMYPIVATQLIRGLPHLETLLAMPLSLSMGAAEWNLYWYRRRTSRLLRGIRNLREFSVAAGRLLAVAVLRYVLVAAVLIAVTATVVAAVDTVTPQWITIEASAFLLLGVALFVALLTQAFGGGLLPPLACLAALGAEVVLAMVTTVNPVVIQLAVCWVLMVALVGHAAITLGNAIRHG